MNRILFSLFLSLCLPVFSFSQSIGIVLGKYTNANGNAFLEPLMDAATLGMQTGYAYDARVPKNAFRVVIGMHTMMGFVTPNQKTFMATTDGFFTPQQTVEAPTVLGSPEGATATGDGGTYYQFPGGAGLQYLPFSAPQLGISGVFGTEVVGRFAAFSNADFGGFTFYSVGIRHSISQYFGDNPPVDLSVGYYNNAFRVKVLDQPENNLDFSSNLVQLLAGKHFGVFHVYGGGGYQFGESTATYFDEDTETTLAQVYEDQNFVRFLLGMGLDLHPFFISTDINLGTMPIWHTTLGFNIGKKDRSGK